MGEESFSQPEDRKGNEKSEEMENSADACGFLSSEPDFRFDKSLQELKDLRSQLHFAADYCETTFLNATDKQVVMENTKDYVCRSMVTLVDHLGNVSANLDCCISKTNSISEAEIRLDCMLQRFLSCESYTHKLALTQLPWSVQMPRHHPRYISPSTTYVGRLNKLQTGNRDDDKKLVTKEDFPLYLFADENSSSVIKSKSVVLGDKNDANLTSVLPVRDGLSILSRGPNPRFHFQLGTQRAGRRRSKSMHGAEIWSLIRRAKRAI